MPVISMFFGVIIMMYLSMINNIIFRIFMSSTVKNLPCGPFHRETC